MKTITAIQQELITHFSSFEDWTQKYEYLIELGKKATISQNSALKTPEKLIKGCQSQVWLNATFTEGKVYYEADSDALLVKGIVQMLLSIYSGQSPEDIIGSNYSFLDQLELTEHLSPTRANGLLAILKQIKLYAIAFKLKNN